MTEQNISRDRLSINDAHAGETERVFSLSVPPVGGGGG